MSVADLLARLENDIRYDCHSTGTKVSRSWAGQELRTRGGEAVQAITERLRIMDAQLSQNQVEAGVREGIAMLLSWMTQDSVRHAAVGSSDISVTMQAGLSV